MCTAVAEIWRLIHCIDLDTNKASIFFAIATKARRAVLPYTHHVAAIERNTVPIDDPEVAYTARRRPLTRTDTAGFEVVEWELMIDHVINAIIAEVIHRCGWKHRNRHHADRVRRLQLLLHHRFAETTTGGHCSVTDIALTASESVESLRTIQADLNRVLRLRYDDPRPVSSADTWVAARAA